MSDADRDSIGKYRLIEKIGRGAMAEVYKAHHPILDRYVAIKILHSFLSEKTDILNRFQREAKHIASLSHPNIVQVYDFDSFGVLYYMVMELIDGATLKNLVKENQTEGKLLPFKESVRIITDVGKALAYAHSRGVVHRDVKPANIMIDKGNRVVLTDFGLAKITSGPQFTTTGALVGTPAYMSPEQGVGQQGDARSDIYSLGAVFYQLVTGRFPFIAETPIATVFKHINAPLPWPRTINPDIPEELERILVLLLEKNPDNRYQTADEMVNDLEKFKKALEKIPDNQDILATSHLPSIVKEMAIALHVIETGQILALENSQEFTLGRLDGAARPDLDLSPYNGLKQGVSRLHASIQIDDQQTVTLVDLGSTNGSWLNGIRIEPHIPVTLNNGDVIALGKLVLQALIR
jgi:eukaryotic-like serine/threonine-protein kinase